MSTKTLLSVTNLCSSFVISPSPSPSVLRAPPASGIEVAGAVLAIVLAVAAAWLGYRLIRGGRGI